MNSAKHAANKTYKIKKGRLLGIIIFLALIIAASGVLYHNIYNTKACDAQNAAVQPFEIANGASTKAIA